MALLGRIGENWSDRSYGTVGTRWMSLDIHTLDIVDALH
jgi:hypothetical protein